MCQIFNFFLSRWISVVVIYYTWFGMKDVPNTLFSVMLYTMFILEPLIDTVTVTVRNCHETTVKPMTACEVNFNQSEYSNTSPSRSWVFFTLTKPDLRKSNIMFTHVNARIHRKIGTDSWIFEKYFTRSNNRKKVPSVLWNEYS